MSVDVYIAAVPEGEMKKVFPPRRQAQLEETGKEEHRRQRYAVWKLLEYGLRKSLGLELSRLSLNLDQRGRWSCDRCFFSLSHSHQAVAVAISREPVGVDVEGLDRDLHPGLAGKLLDTREERELESLDPAAKKQRLLQAWCRKESIFKWKEAAEGERPAVLWTGTVTVAGGDYCYAVAADREPQLIILEDALWN